MITCTKCQEEKPASEFGPRKSGPKSHHSWCKRCQRLESKRRYRERSRDPVKNSRLKASFGIDLDEYQSLLEFQGGVCAICNSPETTVGNGGVAKALAVDHCHSSGKVRGLLCQKCNQALGMFGDDTNTLKQAINYLTKEGL